MATKYSLGHIVGVLYGRLGVGAAAEAEIVTALSSRIKPQLDPKP